MHADRYSVPATTKGKRLEEREKRTRQGGTREEKEEQRREHSGKFRRVKHKGKPHEDIETEEQRNGSRRN